MARVKNKILIPLLAVTMAFSLTACGGFTQDDIDNAVNSATLDLNAQIDQLTASIADKEAKIATLESEKAALTAEKTELEAEIETLEAEKATLESEKAALQADVNTLEDEKATLTAKSEQLDEDIKSLNDKIAELEASGEENTEEINQLKAELSTLEEEKTNINGRVTELENSISTKNAEIETLNASISALETEKANLTARVSELEASISAKDTEISDLNTSIAMLQAEKQTLSDRITELEDKNEALESEKSELEKENAVLKNCLAGKHVLNTYTDNGDGTLSGICIHCSATHTAIDISTATVKVSFGNEEWYELKDKMFEEAEENGTEFDDEAFHALVYELRSKTSLTYNGKEQTQYVYQVIVGDTVLTEDDYTLSGNVGTLSGEEYTLTITGKGDYAGTVNANWTINRKYIHIEPAGQTVVRGEQLKNEATIIGNDLLCEGHTLTVTVYTDLNLETLEAGDYSNWSSIDSYKITDENGEDVTQHYDVYTANGDFTLVEPETAE